VVRVCESLDLKLAWRSFKDAPPKAIGCYRLNLRLLLSHGYVRVDKLTEPDSVRLQFVHENDDGIYIRVRAAILDFMLAPSAMWFEVHNRTAPLLL
jgi:hypothetical protein